MEAQQAATAHAAAPTPAPAPTPSPVLLQLAYEATPSPSSAASAAAHASDASSAAAASSMSAEEVARARAILDAQPAQGMRDFFIKRYETESVKNWDRFYKRNADRFYKDRHYLTNEFKELSELLDSDRQARHASGQAEAEAVAPSSAAAANAAAEQQNEEEASADTSPAAAASPASASPPAPLLPISKPTAVPQAHQRRLLEVGCGVGNALLPLLRLHSDCFFYGVDCSRNAIQVLQNASDYISSGRAAAWVVDLVTEELPAVMREDALDFATLIFVLSAIHPEKMRGVLEKVHRALKKDEGVLFLRDYALYDLAQLRFASTSKLGSNWYVRQDGTRSYYFEAEELSALLEAAGFEIIECVVVKKTVINRKENSEMSRRFVQLRAKAKRNKEEKEQQADAAAADS